MHFVVKVCFSSLDVDFVEVFCPTELGVAPRDDPSKSLQNPFQESVAAKKSAPYKVISQARSSLK